MRTKIRNRRVNEKGQGMTEYIIIVALVAIAAIAVYAFFGEDIRDQMAGISSELSGTSAQTNISNAQTAATNAGTAANKNKNLGTYTNKSVGE